MSIVTRKGRWGRESRNDETKASNILNFPDIFQQVLLLENMEVQTS